MTAKLIERQIRLFVGFTKAKASEEDIQTLVRVLVSANQEEERFDTLMGIPVRLDPDMPEDKIRFENRQGEIVGEPLARRAAEGRTPPTWQPIETAPKDGTEILLKGSTWIRTGYWAKRVERWSVDAAVRLSDPTHWMPLPPAPPPSATEGR